MWARPLALAAALLAAAPAPTREGDDRAVLAALTAQDLRVATVSYRLLTAGPPLCDTLALQSGLLIHDALQYSVALRPAAVRAFGFAGRPALSAVVPGSPADRAGLVAGDTITTVDGVAVPATDVPQPDRRAPDYAATAALRTQLAAAFAQGLATLTIVRDGAERVVRVDPVAGCASAVEVQAGTTRNAWSDGHAVALTSAMVAAAASDDELAIVIGHELSHNFLHHRERLDAAGIGQGLGSRIGRKAAQVRETENEADALGLYLAARAGYDPAAAAVFWQRFGSEHGDGLFTDATHPGWRDRVATLTRIAAEIAARRRAGLALVPDQADARH